MKATNATGTPDEFLSFRLGSEEYAIDILQVQEIRAHEAVTRIAGAPGFMSGVINLRGAIVPIVDMRVKFAMPRADYDLFTVVIILRIGNQMLGIVVDAVCDVVALMPGQVKPAPVMSTSLDSKFIRGLAPIGERMLIVLDIARLLIGGELALVAEAAAA
jgi:purine-binding chemotaxis protein CheW